MNKEYYKKVLDFFNYVKKNSINLSFSEIDNEIAKTYLNDFTNILLNSNISYQQSSLSLTPSKVYDLATQILYIMFGKTFSNDDIDELKNKIIITDGANPFEGGIGYLDQEKYIILECANSNYSVPTLTHESTHYLTDGKYYSNYHHIETLPILIEFITSLILDGMNIGNNNYEAIIAERFITLQERIKDKIKYTITSNDRLNNQLLEQKQMFYVYSSNIAYTYLISTIYALNLLVYYKQDVFAFISKLNRTLKYQNGLEDLIKYYNIDLNKRETYDEPIRILNNY